MFPEVLLKILPEDTPGYSSGDFFGKFFQELFKISEVPPRILKIPPNILSGIRLEVISGIFPIVSAALLAEF